MRECGGSEGIIPLALARMAYGVGATLAPETTLRFLGFPEDRASPTCRVWAGMFGVRELVLPAVLISSRKQPAALQLGLAFAAAADFGDALIGARALVRRDGIDRAAAGILVSGLAGAVASVAAYRATLGGIERD